ncbi:hypothetical protein EMIHUDRAFT_231045 [Emiliania huxleyi CCMP1516]|uniref:Uncharacterized protein n=2 Tax=Emiliania huxleyi TaxID=2903 RepID=A0A0D3K962_EMIH1|nr:hypothetical protein EMIHUDRAFT_231045 [Emiliania huxleyi CCMP1516]EOD32297.1 hypothetical protein EMIHUDRAFT_231045 [Emiliania huxleyi CCMP1516]|eukprot:XP_005784726.1 hypothetical protein EMIHUDRAFT_231045 [Emiliania huxleyi CCMP1516]
MESVMPFLRENIESNGVVGAVEAAPLLWGTDVSDFGAPVDAVLMADVAYTDAYAELAATLASESHVLAKSTVFQTLLKFARGTGAYREEGR